MRKILVIIIIVSVVILFACSSEKANELVDYHNTYLNTVNPLADQIDEASLALGDLETTDEALDYQTREIMPLVHEVVDFIQSQEPKAEAVQELHELRKNQLTTWGEGFELRTEALQKSTDGSDKKEIKEVVEQLEQRFEEAQEMAEKADKRFMELAKKYNVKVQ